MQKVLERKRQALIRSFEERKPDMLEDLREDFGDVVKDLRLHGSVLKQETFTERSDVDVAVIIDDTNASLWVIKLHKALFGGRYPLRVYYRGEPIQVDPITMCEGEWPTWSRGRTKEERGI